MYTCEDNTFVMRPIKKVEEEVDDLTNASWWQDKFGKALMEKETKGKGKKKGGYTNAATFY